MSLFTSLRSAAGSLSAFDQALSVTQDNVSNASTPGYAKQQVTLEALEFGGVRAGPLTSARDQFAEQTVRRQVTSWGYPQQQTETLSALQNVFDIRPVILLPAENSKHLLGPGQFLTSKIEPPIANMRKPFRIFQTRFILTNRSLCKLALGNIVN